MATRPAPPDINALFRPRRRASTPLRFLGVVWVLCASAVSAAGAQGPGAQRDTTTGFPIRDTLVVAKCAGCHVKDSTGRVLQRLSLLRKTSEVWETSVRRMVRPHGGKLEHADARAIVKSLDDQQGIAPAEARRGRFEVERRLVDHRYTAETTTERT